MAEHINNFLKYIEDTVYKGQCADCSETFPNRKTRVRTRDAMHSWKKRHQIKSGHTVRTAVTHVRLYPGEKKV